ncbi:MAG: RDD family protein [Alphaproteobacteria bacterium]|nr:RDD family protein [Alphaproteobacteria bacterium]
MPSQNAPAREDVFGAKILPARALEGVRTRRMLALLLDLIVLTIFVGGLIVALGALGFITAGFTWVLIPLAVIGCPLIALFYNGFTMSGWRRATPGMRLMDLEVRIASDATPVSFLHAAVHAVLFYISWTILTPLVLIAALIMPNKRCLHDILSNMVVIRRPD